MTDAKNPPLLPLLPTEVPYLISALEQWIAMHTGTGDQDARTQLTWVHERAMKLLSGRPVGMPRGSGSTTDKILNELIEARARAFRAMLAEARGSRGQQLQARVASMEAGMRQMWSDLVEMGVLVVINDRS